MDDNKQDASFEEEDGGLQLDNVSSLEKAATIEPWYVSSSRSFGRFLAKIGVGILGFLFDAVKALISVFIGIFYGAYRLVKAVYTGFRNAHRRFYEVDGYGKGSYFLMGLSHFKRGLIGEGIIYLVVEIVFIAWFAVMGCSGLIELSLSEAVTEAYRIDGNQVPLILGIISIIVIVAFVAFYCLYLRSIHDIYVIVNEPAFKNAHKTAVDVIEHNADYEDVANATFGFQRRKILRDVYGFSELQARYISYAPWAKLENEEEGEEDKGPKLSLGDKILISYDQARKSIYDFYDGIRKKVRLAGLGELFQHFLEWQFIPHEVKRGYGYVYQETRRSYIKFIHTYDKYNDYYSVTREAKAIIHILKDPDMVLDCVHSRDPISVKAGPDALGGPEMTIVYALREPGKYLKAAFPAEAAGQKLTIKNIEKTLNEKIALEEKLCKALSRVFYHSMKATGEPAVEGAEPYLANGKVNPDALKGHGLEENVKLYLGYYERRCKDYAVKHEAERETSPKMIAGRLVGVYGGSYEDCLKVAEMYVLAHKMKDKKAPSSPVPKFSKDSQVNKFYLIGLDEKEALKVYLESYEKRLAAFEKQNEDRKASARALAAIFGEADHYRVALDAGQNALSSALLSEHPELTDRDLEVAVDELKHAVNLEKSGGMPLSSYFAMKGERVKGYVSESQLDFHGQPTTFKRKAKQYLDERFAVTVLTLPVLGSLIVTIVPLIFSILIAFTDWDTKTYANKHFTWNPSAWAELFGMGEQGSKFMDTFLELLVWTLVWAVLATFINYILGIVLALMINRKGIRLKKMWRTIFVVTIAIPQFITLLAMRRIFAETGPINTWLMGQSWYSGPGGLAQSLGFGEVDSAGVFNALPFPFLGGSKINGNLPYSGDSPFVFAFTRAFWPKLSIILINIWVGIPYTMLSTSGILMNIPEDLYESAQIDGANKWRQFWSITMPYILFVTGPSLLTTFIGNINNFNVIFFLTGGGALTNDLYYQAKDTSLLITWIFNMSTAATPSYNEASALGCIIFLICGFFSLIAYKRLGSVQNEEDFQ